MPNARLYSRYMQLLSADHIETRTGCYAGVRLSPRKRDSGLGLFGTYSRAAIKLVDPTCLAPAHHVDSDYPTIVGGFESLFHTLFRFLQ